WKGGYRYRILGSKEEPVIRCQCAASPGCAQVGPNPEVRINAAPEWDPNPSWSGRSRGAVRAPAEAGRHQTTCVSESQSSSECARIGLRFAGVAVRLADDLSHAQAAAGQQKWGQVAPVIAAA